VERTIHLRTASVFLTLHSLLFTYHFRYGAISSAVERLLHTQEVAGSNPASRTNHRRTGDPQVQKDLVPLIADTKAHILIKGTAAGKDKTFRIVTGVFFDEAAKALELFDTANVAVAYATATGALQLTEGKTKAGVVWPEELDAARSSPCRIRSD
jgi:hypothetical protein